MDPRLIAVIAQLSNDLANMEKALASTQAALQALIKDARRNGRHLSKEDATMLFLANQQPRWSGTAPWHTRLRENDEE